MTIVRAAAVQEWRSGTAAEPGTVTGAARLTLRKAKEGGMGEKLPLPTRLSERAASANVDLVAL